jgi:hypothetical protein
MSADPVISLKKSGWMVIQSASGIALGYACSLLASKTGIQVPPELQLQILALLSVLGVSVVHGVSNFAKHWITDRGMITKKP